MRRISELAQLAFNNFLRATPVCTVLFGLSQVPGVPDDNL